MDFSHRRKLTKFMKKRIERSIRSRLKSVVSSLRSETIVCAVKYVTGYEQTRTYVLCHESESSREQARRFDFPAGKSQAERGNSMVL